MSEKESKELLIKKVKEMKDKGYVESTRKGDTGIGKTSEDLLGKKEDNLQEPDFHGFEVKANAKTSPSLITLTTKAPKRSEDGKNIRGANSRITDMIGSPSEEFPNVNTLHTTLYAHRITQIGEDYTGQLKLEGDTIKLEFKNKEGEIVDDNNYYKLSDFEKGLKKLEKTAFIGVDTRTKEDGKKEYHYNEIEIHEKPTVEKLKECILAGDVAIDIRMGVYQNPENEKTYGKRHDHGTAIRISKESKGKLFSEKHKIDISEDKN